MTLAIETSCDDTSVAIVEKELQDSQPVARIHFHEKVTSNNAAFRGVHPLVSLQSHQENLAILVSKAIQHLPDRRLPDFVSVTRGPGMRSNLFTGLDTAKGLAVAWQVLHAIVYQPWRNLSNVFARNHWLESIICKLMHLHLV